MTTLDIVEALGLLTTLSQRIEEAVRSGQTTIEVSELGSRFASLNERIQAARGGDSSG